MPEIIHAQLERQKLRDAKHAQLLKDREEGRLLEAMTISQRLEHLKSALPNPNRNPHFHPHPSPDLGLLEVQPIPTSL